MTVAHDAIAHNDAARERLESALADRSLLEHPAPELVRGARVVVYGAGNVGREVARLLLSVGLIVCLRSEKARGERQLVLTDC